MEESESIRLLGSCEWMSKKWQARVVYVCM